MEYAASAIISCSSNSKHKFGSMTQPDTKAVSLFLQCSSGPYAGFSEGGFEMERKETKN